MESLYKLILLVLVSLINTIYCTENDKTNLSSLQKCCLFDQTVGRKNGIQKVCTSTNKPLLYSQIRVFDDNRKITNKTLSNDTFNLVPGKFYTDEDFHINSINNNIKALLKSNFYLTESALLYLEMPNGYNRWTEFDQNSFCVDFYTNGKTGVVKPAFWIKLKGPSKAQSDFVTIPMMVSCCFLLIVLLVYAILPDLRNLGGMILMAYVASLLVAFLCLALIRILTQENNLDVCYFMTLIIYYFFLASFCWMNVMSYDIWWTFRGYAKTRPIHRRGEPFKYMMYSLYSWGLPLALTIMLVCIDKADLSDKPWFVKPNMQKTNCFIDDGEKFLYLYVPMLILILANWLFFLLTAWNIWRLSRGTSVLDSGAAGKPSPHRSNQQRFLLYLKLTIVMGLSWVMEVISFLAPGFRLWYITDIYNVLIGVLIFLIFVCKKKIIRKLANLYSELGKKGKYNLSITTRISSESNLEQQSMSASHKKPGYVVNDF